jgi:hypothetical protein
VLHGALLEGSPSHRKGWIEIANAAQGREAVDFLTKWGVDFIKVHNNLSRESYFAIAEEAKKTVCCWIEKRWIAGKLRLKWGPTPK